MSTSSAIEWTDATWNPVTGCTKVSPGCAHCYAEVIALRFWPSQYPPVEYDSYSVDACCPITEMRIRQFTDVQTHADRLMQPLRWRKPQRIFVNSMSDLFHDDVPDQFIVDVFGVMALAHWHTFQVLTKRPERMLKFLAAGDHGILRQFMLLQQNGGTSTREAFRALDLKRRDNIEWRWPLPNVWLGVSVENQHFADERIRLLYKTPAAIRFLSCEPLLGPVDLSHQVNPLSDLDWVIVGGESGPKSRPFDVQWARSIVQQCQSAHVPVFVKQLGANVRDRNDAGFDGSGVNDIDGRCSWPEMDTDDIEDAPDCYRDEYQGAPVRVHLRSRKGGDPDEWPADLRIRQFPVIA